MDFDYVTSRDKADQLIRKFGRAVKVRRVTTSGPAWEPVQTETDSPTFGVRVDFTWRQLQSGNVLASDQRWIVAAGPLAALGVTEILPTDKLVVDGVALQFAPLTSPLNPAGTVVLFDCQVRV
jgi:hypothetical protein